MHNFLMSKPLRILHVMLGRGLGGIEFAYARYAAGLAGQGHEVIHCITEGAAISSHIAAYGKVETLAPHSQYDPRLILAAHRLLKQHSPDVIIAHGKRADRVFTYTQSVFPKTVSHIEVLHRARFHKLHRADLTITVNDVLRRAFIAHHGEGAAVEMHPNFLLSLPTPEARRPWGDAPVIGCIGRFVSEKGIDLLLEAAALLRAEGLEFRLHIAGDGAEKPALLAQAERLGLGSVIKWCGWVENQADFYQAIDMLCVPSRSESFGLVVIEAMAYGLPVVSTRTDGPSGIIEHGMTGLLCEIQPKALAETLKSILHHSSHAQSMGERASKEVQHYHVSHVMPRISESIRQTVEQFHR
jgi:glycosyltransferase involved in cell wall biosynthesis